MAGKKPRKIDPAELRVIIPVGGQAKRLRPLTTEVSKAVVRIFNRPVVEIAMAHLASQGVRNFLFGAKGYINYKSLIDYFGEGIGFSTQYGFEPEVHIKYQPRVDDLGSADSVRINMDYYNIDGHIMVVQGDNLFELDLGDLLAFHEEKRGVMTMVLTYVDEPERYGVAVLDNDGRAEAFMEKPDREKTPSRLANTGIYLLSPEAKGIFDRPEVRSMVKERHRLDFGLDFIPFLIETGYPVYGYVLEGAWYDVGTPRTYLETMVRILREGSRTSFFGDPVPGFERVWIQGRTSESLQKREEIVRKVRYGKVRLEGSVIIGSHCEIGEGSEIRDSCIDNFCIIQEDATIERSAIMDRVIVGEGARIEDSIIGRHVYVKSSRRNPTWIHGLSVIGDDAVIGEGSFMTATKLRPHGTVPEGARMVEETVE